MRFFVNGKCIGCGLCAATCPGVFSLGEGQARTDLEEVAEKDLPLAKKAEACCPVNAIERV